MIVGMGTDIVAVERMARLHARFGERLAERLLGPLEVADMPAEAAAGAAFLARRFAAKEATFKALGSGMTNGVRWMDVQVGHDSGGRPQLVLGGRAQQLLQGLGDGVRSWLSISDERRYAMAVVVLERGG
ncbi:MAG: holo-ACP synthase [Acidithiobacillus sp.]|jgi:holo-[acyl-carrier protein] synthase|uniref:Holo-ACP synthase n=1 Tax=Acidithiobacillus ferruginosus TaxID=3063951 RepID=A0ACD5IKZ6_9PROT|nr:holo-ACP synthase [Acidithiobacillus ferruginosus]MBU2812887.1 holo-ACP synthase [Acidithiobacillus ferruginosus]